MGQIDCELDVAGVEVTSALQMRLCCREFAELEVETPKRPVGLRHTGIELDRALEARDGLLVLAAAQGLECLTVEVCGALTSERGCGSDDEPKEERKAKQYPRRQLRPSVLRGSGTIPCASTSMRPHSQRVARPLSPAGAGGPSPDPFRNRNGKGGNSGPPVVARHFVVSSRLSGRPRKKTDAVLSSDAGEGEVNMARNDTAPPLPSDWPKHVQAAVLHVIVWPG